METGYCPLKSNRNMIALLGEHSHSERSFRVGHVINDNDNDDDDDIEDDDDGYSSYSSSSTSVSSLHYSCITLQFIK